MRADLQTVRRLLPAALLLPLGACDWFTDFKDQPRIEPWESYALADSTGRIDTTSGPDKRPAGRQGRSVRYIETLRPCSRLRTGTPASSSARSKLKLHPTRKVTRSSVHRSTTSVGSSTRRPSRQTR